MTTPTNLAQGVQETLTVPFNPCLAKLRPGEPFFVLLGRDKQAPNAVMTWANDRQAAEGKSAWTDQAREVAYTMAAYSGIGPSVSSTQSPTPGAPEIDEADGDFDTPIVSDHDSRKVQP